MDLFRSPDGHNDNRCAGLFGNVENTRRETGAILRFLLRVPSGYTPIETSPL